jgi:hypothetical protein
MIDIDQKAIAHTFATMSESELMDSARHYDKLVGPVQALLREEFARRSMEPPLLDEDQEDETSASRTLVTIRTFRDLGEAFVTRGLLESAGIACHLQDENLIRADWLLSNVIGGARLQVAASDEEQALEILSQPIPTSFEMDDSFAFVQPACPQCGSLDISLNDRSQKWAATSAATLSFPPVLLGLPLLAFQKSMYVANLWKCATCGCLWQDDPASDNATAPVN